MQKTPPPVPRCPSRRLIGLELEFDAGPYAAFHQPTLPPGWQSKADVSLNNGREYVLEPPLPAIEALEAVEAFSDASVKAKMHLCMKGGYHIHVQIHDFDIHAAERLAQLYWKFQPCIDQLVGASRRQNSFCAPFPSKPTTAYLATAFSLDHVARDRPAAKLTRQRLVVNFAMMRCINPMDRTAEFRQPSPSKLTTNIYGWAVLAVVLVEMAANQKRACDRFINGTGTWAQFLAFCRRAERNLGVVDLVEWVVWRREYLSAKFDEALAHKMYHALVQRPRGTFQLARLLNINYAAVKAMLEAGVRDEKIVKAEPRGWRAKYDSVAAMDLKAIMDKWALEEQPATVTAAPAPVSVPTP